MDRRLSPPAWLAWLALASLTPACVLEASSPPPDVAPGAPAGAIVGQPPLPPPPQTDAIVVRPSADHDWIAGYWGWGGHSYVWHPGRWERRPHQDARWEPGHWQPEGQGHVWVEGHWQPAASAR